MGKIRLVVTAGDPAGIGPEVAVAALKNGSASRLAHALLLCPRQAALRAGASGPAGFAFLPRRPMALGQRSRSPGETPWADPMSPDSPIPDWASEEASGLAELWDTALERRGHRATPGVFVACPSRWDGLACRPGKWTRRTGEASAALVAVAAALCLPRDSRRGAEGMVTGPICKAAWKAAGVDFPGHTEYLAHLSGATGQETMLLAGGGLRVALATVHEPLARVPGLLSAERVANTGLGLARGLRTRFGLGAPRIGVLGLNPHAGENGHLGGEDGQIIRPAVARLRAAGVDAQGPLPADTAFLRARRGEFDALLAMYHDQGLGPFKTVAGGRGVNVTLGLPCIRTSVDHGTAFDIAGTGQASSASMVAAIRLAARMAEKASRSPA